MSEGDKEYNGGGGGGSTKAQGIYDDDGDTSSSGYWEGVGRTVLPPALAGFSFSSSSSFVVAVFSVVIVFVIIPPLLIVLSRGFLLVLLVSLALSTIRAEGTTNVSYCIIIRLFLSWDRTIRRGGVMTNTTTTEKTATINDNDDKNENPAKAGRSNVPPHALPISRG